jgi:hypothetical protein
VESFGFDHAYLVSQRPVSGWASLSQNLGIFKNYFVGYEKPAEFHM